MKISYLTDKLNLTSDEATKFWPLFNAFEQKQKELKQDKKRSYLDRLEDEKVDAMTDKEATGYLAQMESTDEELYQLRKKFIASLKGVLPAIKIIKLKQAEDGFNRKLLKQYRENGTRK